MRAKGIVRSSFRSERRQSCTTSAVVDVVSMGELVVITRSVAALTSSEYVRIEAPGNAGSTELAERMKRPSGVNSARPPASSFDLPSPNYSVASTVPSASRA